MEGLPLRTEVQNEAITDYVFLIRAEDNSGSAAHDLITVRIFPRPTIVNFLVVFFEGDFDAFNQNLSAKLQLVTRLATTPGDANTDAVYVREFRSGSIAVSYNNLSISDLNCADFRAWVREIFVNGEYTDNFVQAAMPFVPTSTPIIEGPCNTSDTNIDPTVAVPPIEIDPGFNSDRIIILATLIPTAVIALALLVIGVIAFVTYRRTRSERKLLIYESMEDTFLNRRPVTLLGETELPPRGRRPIILANELALARAETPPVTRGHAGLEETDRGLIRPESETSSDDELELVNLPLLSPRRTGLLSFGHPPPYRLPPDYTYPS